MEIEEQVDISMLFRLINNQGIAASIRTGEQMQVGKTMQRDILSMEKGRESDTREDKEDFTI